MNIENLKPSQSKCSFIVVLVFLLLATKEVHFLFLLNFESMFGTWKNFGKKLIRKKYKNLLNFLTQPLHTLF